MRDRRDVQDEVRRSAEGGVRDHRVAQRGVGEDVAHREAARLQRHQRAARTGAPCRARSGVPMAPSAEWPSDRPSASPTTCDVAAVPRNWQPPPGDAQARQPELGSLLQRDLAVHEPDADRLHAAGVVALVGQQRDAARAPARTARSCMAASAIIIAGSPLSQVATPSTPRAVGSDRISRRKIVAASLR